MSLLLVSLVHEITNKKKTHSNVFVISIHSETILWHRITYLGTNFIDPNTKSDEHCQELRTASIHMPNKLVSIYSDLITSSQPSTFPLIFSLHTSFLILHTSYNNRLINHNRFFFFFFERNHNRFWEGPSTEITSPFRN